jgi:serine/threonine-protein kinase
MLSGRPPFRGETSLTLAMQHLTKVPEPLTGLRSDLPPVVCEIVHKMMAREPAKRYQHAREIQQDLKRLAKILKEDPEAAGTARLAKMNAAPTSSAWRERFFRWSLARHAALLGLLALVVASAAAAVGWWARPANPLEGTATKHDRIPRLGSAKEQFERANQLQNDEDAWRAVLDYFPADRTYTAEAKERLAVLYLKGHRLDEAKKTFEELEAMGQEDPKAKAVGIAGMAIIASLKGEYQESQRLIVYELRELPRRREQFTDDLWLLLRRAGRESAQHLAGDARKQLTDLFDDEP